MTYPNLSSVLPERAVRAIREVYDLIAKVQGRVDSVEQAGYLTQGEAAAQFGASTQKATLQAGGNAQLDVTGLSGRLAQPQIAYIPSVTSLPTYADPLSQDGAMVSLNGVTYRFDGSTDPGTWVATEIADAVLGATALTTDGAIPKVSATDGTLDESALTDDGAKITSAEPVEIDTGATPQASQLVLRANGAGVFSALCYATNNVSAGFDAEFAAGGWVAQGTAIAVAVKNATHLKWYGSTGNSVGAAATLTYRLGLDLATGAFDVAGNLTIGGDVGFFGSAAAAKQTLNAYSSNSQAAYTSTPATLAQAATLFDLNQLRVAYENLRASYDDLRTKLKTTTLVG
jgi:hypothetical protein